MKASRLYGIWLLRAGAGHVPEPRLKIVLEQGN